MSISRKQQDLLRKKAETILQGLYQQASSPPLDESEKRINQEVEEDVADLKFKKSFKHSFERALTALVVANVPMEDAIAKAEAIAYVVAYYDLYLDTDSSEPPTFEDDSYEK